MRETVYVLIGKGDHAGQELQRLMDQDQMGPLGYWALSQLLGMAGHPATSFVARNGQLYLDQNNYKRSQITDFCPPSFEEKACKSG